MLQDLFPIHPFILVYDQSLFQEVTSLLADSLTIDCIVDKRGVVICYLQSFSISVFEKILVLVIVSHKEEDHPQGPDISLNHLEYTFSPYS